MSILKNRSASRTSRYDLPSGECVSINSEEYTEETTLRVSLRLVSLEPGHGVADLDQHALREAHRILSDIMKEYDARAVPKQQGQQPFSPE